MANHLYHGLVEQLRQRFKISLYSHYSRSQGKNQLYWRKSDYRTYSEGAIRLQRSNTVITLVV